MKRYRIYTVILIILSIVTVGIISMDDKTLNNASIRTLDNITDKYNNNALISLNNTSNSVKKSVSRKKKQEIKEEDTEAPNIKYKKTLSTTVGKKINLLKKVTVTDNSGEEIKATVEGEYDINTVGSYKLKYVAVDSSNNKTEVKFTLNVNEVTPVVEEVQPTVATNVPVVVGTMRQKMVAIAKSQIGNYNGNPYWSWYGFKGRVAWCACFVSWVANQAGALNTYIPKFAGVGIGVSYFKKHGQWKNKDYTPSPGDIIFFDWGHPGRATHVGLVEKVENGRVYVLEGNTNKNMVENRSYASNHKNIIGYGVPSY